MKLYFLLLTILSVFIINISNAQKANPLGQKANRYISTGVPFLMISPDARASAMGDVGVSSSPDIYSMHWNPAKYAFIKDDIGIGISYSPWLKQLISDLNLYSLNFYRRIDDKQTFAASLLYFSLGEIDETSEEGLEISKFHPNEFSFDVAYARKLSENFSAAIAARFIYSDLTQGRGEGAKAGTSIAADLSIFWRKEVTIGRSNGLFAFGVNLSNIGAKISYVINGDKEFLPTNLRFGPSLMVEIDRYNTFTFMLDINKLLVPTPQNDKEDNISVEQGIFQSFFDAPDGFSEELKEFQISFGAEYWYDKQFALRAGYFYESAEKGNRKYFTVGAGLKYNVFGLDFSYLIPTAQQHPLANTLRFSLLFDFGAPSKTYRRKY
jgi:hypothetical protein